VIKLPYIRLKLLFVVNEYVTLINVGRDSLRVKETTRNVSLYSKYTSPIAPC